MQHLSARRSGFTLIRTNKTSGFTLIELLVVIAIIGLLSSVVLASLNTARAKARDAKRLTDIRQYVSALEIYYNDNNAYPYVNSATWNCLGEGYAGGWCWGTGYTEAASVVNTALEGAYLPALPQTGKVINTYGYIYRCLTASPCQRYDIRYFLENPNQSCVGSLLSANYSGYGITYCMVSPN